MSEFGQRRCWPIPKIYGPHTHSGADSSRPLFYIKMSVLDVFYFPILDFSYSKNDNPGHLRM
ncbi:hypothetical protein [Yoonia sp. SS1-5]|uniref:Uncharacterized protein n=1 Tax=Yoonia rhodophyticola TaxID=3137370 RepID=A0AAN0M9Z5_9RHOB